MFKLDFNNIEVKVGYVKRDLFGVTRSGRGIIKSEILINDLDNPENTDIGFVIYSRDINPAGRTFYRWIDARNRVWSIERIGARIFRKELQNVNTKRWLDALRDWLAANPLG